MRFFQKGEAPQFFTEEIEILQEILENRTTKTEKKRVWDSDFKEKKRLKKYILENEQNSLCCYCETELTLSEKGQAGNCHLEHIKPKDLDEKRLTFDYGNLAVSCQGNNCSEDLKAEDSCGHKKENLYDETLFLDPTKERNIRDHFSYNIDTGEIVPETENGRYMRDLLNLNGDLNNLKIARKDALESFEEILETDFEEAISIFEEENIAFISFLKYVYKDVA
jgi:uncharacterized protein (TIGR02646 family)